MDATRFLQENVAMASDRAKASRVLAIVLGNHLQQIALGWVNAPLADAQARVFDKPASPEQGLAARAIIANLAGEWAEELAKMIQLHEQAEEQNGEPDGRRCTHRQNNKTSGYRCALAADHVGWCENAAGTVSWNPDTTGAE